MSLSILITGINGFVGRHIASALLKEGHSVVGLSLEQTPQISHPRLDYYPLDITHRDDVQKLFRAVSLDAVIHLAALVHVRDPRLTFSDYAEVNYLASANLFQSALSTGVRRIVFASTVEVYGPTSAGATVDERAMCRPDSDYARSKLLAEKALTDLASSVDASYSILRLAPVYATNFRENLDKRLYLRAPWLAYKFGAQGSALSFCSVRNIEAWVVRWLAMSQADSGIFNLADRSCYTTQSILDTERRHRRAGIIVRLPTLASLAAIAAREAFFHAIGRDAGFISVANFRKLVNQTCWDTSRAIAAVGDLPGDLELDLYSS